MKNKYYFSTSDSVVEHMRSQEYIEEIRLRAYYKFVEGSNDSVKNWNKAESELRSHYFEIYDYLCYEEEDISEPILFQFVDFMVNNMWIVVLFLGLVAMACLSQCK